MMGMTKSINVWPIFALVLLVIHCSQSLFIPSVYVSSSYQTGNFEYTVLTNQSSVSCSSVAAYGHSGVIILKDGQSLKTGKIIATVYSSINYNELLPEENYSCYQNISNKLPNGANYVYAMNRNFKIRQRGDVLCETSIGNAGGVFREAIRLICVGNGHGWKSLSVGRFTTVNTIYQTIGAKTNERSCGYFTRMGRWIETCRIRDVIVRSLQIEILPKTFTNFSNLLYFECRSNPPRLMYWAVHSSCGNILDPANHNQSIKSNTDIYIDQSAGFTSINVTEEFAGGNGIHTVVCFTYDTHIVIATAYLVTQPSVSMDTEYENTAATYTMEEQEHHTNPLHVNISYIVVITILSFIIVIQMVLFKVQHQVFKSQRNNLHDTVDLDKDVVPAGTDLHYNIVYQSVDSNIATEVDNNYDMVDQDDSNS